MPQFKKIVILLVLFLIPFNIAIALWLFAHDLKTRFPNIDFSRAKFGVASWYSEGDKYINPKTANGEEFDDRGMTCASWDYPFGKKLLVINAFTGRWIVCRVNDRGPAKHLRRQIDLTKGAFQKIANLRKGLIYVTVIPTDKNAIKA